jgi:site-specific DNA-methyltransferase (adenine-specific)/site-specific DNA-methyltransferase (cytosine-N4-specific)
VRALNLARRHLDHPARTRIIADELRENPERSNRWIARSLGVDDKAVARVRAGMQATAALPQFGFTLGADGKYRPATRDNLPSNGNGRYACEPQGDEERKYVYLDDEERILRAAAQIRQRRVAERLKQIQENRRRSRPVRIRRGGPVLHGDCLDLIPTLEDGSLSLVVTSPPYAQHRAGHYEGIPEEDYPDFTVNWMTALASKMTKDGSVLIIIRPHLRDGVLSDYLLRTRLALREAGWCECEELVWLKPDAPPLGSKLRPRRAWESVLWFSQSAQPYADLKACGKESDRLGFNGSIKFAEDGISEKTAWHPCVESFGKGRGVARISDVIVADVGGNEPGLDHPAVFPAALADQLVRTFSQERDLVLDPFCGSGQSLLAAKGCGRRYLGIEREGKYVAIALQRLRG